MIHSASILRHGNHTEQTQGTLLYFIDNKAAYTCKTLELAWLDNQRQISCIPTGTYTVRKHVSPKFGNCLKIHDVVGRSDILIHKGNYAASMNPRTGKPDILGCILLGTDFKRLDADKHFEVVESATAMNKLLNICADEFILTILNANISTEKHEIHHRLS